MRYEVRLFAAGESLTAARGHFIHVYVDKIHRRPVPLRTPSKSFWETLARAASVNAVVPDRTSVDAIAIESRFSARAFHRSTEVPRETIARHPARGQPGASGCFQLTQPWRVYVVRALAATHW